MGINSYQEHPLRMTSAGEGCGREFELGGLVEEGRAPGVAESGGPRQMS